MRKRVSNNLAKRVLLVGMFDSVHFARWITQFRGENVKFTIYPSRKFRKIHPLLAEALNTKDFCDLGNSRLYKFLPKSIYGYLDFLIFIFPVRAPLRLNLRVRFLRRIIRNSDFDFVHLLEFQHAGYLYLDAIKPLISVPPYKLISTNWGSDIYFYQDDWIHRSRIQELLKLTDLYSAECSRDYKLARNLGYMGDFLPCIPNAGGFKIKDVVITPPEARELIVCKAYGGEFGRGDLLLLVLDEFLSLAPSTPVFLFSVTDDLLSDVNRLVEKYPNIKFSDQGRKLPHHELLALFRCAQIYIGLSRSDGISTSFLEALTTGTYPIQSDTSCAQEWVVKGARASIVGLDKEAILLELKDSYNNFEKLSLAQKDNLKVSQEHLDYELIAKAGLIFYS